MRKVCSFNKIVVTGALFLLLSLAVHSRCVLSSTWEH